MTDNRSVVERAEAIEAADAARAQPKRRGKAIGGAALALIAGVLAVEGGYVNNKADPGGETNLGVTKRVAVAHGYNGPMRTLPREVAEDIYYEQYLVAPGYEPLIAIDAAVTEELFDTTVNMGPPRPSRWFQQSINSVCGTSIVPDGRVGQSTIAAYSACQVRLGSTRLCLTMLDSLDGKQRAEYERLVRVNPKLRIFLRGWIANRVGNVDRRKCSKGR
jgi:lysozyme family protein